MPAGVALQPVSNEMGPTFSDLLTGYVGGGFVTGVYDQFVCRMHVHVEDVVGRSVHWLDQGLAGFTIWV
jgi:hypothetical protein